jgi:hypothetical protein
VSNPRPKDVSVRTLDTGTRNDIRQYGQSAMGAFHSSGAMGYNQGQLFYDMAVSLNDTPYHQQETTGRTEIEEAVEVFLDPSYDPNLNIQMTFDLYGSQQEAQVGGNFDPSY